MSIQIIGDYNQFCEFQQLCEFAIDYAIAITYNQFSPLLQILGDSLDNEQMIQCK